MTNLARLIPTKTVSRGTIKGISGLGYCDPYTDYCDDGGWNYFENSGGTATTDNGSSSFWDNLFKAIQIGGQVAVNVIRADQQQYYTPMGAYRYGTGPYSAMQPQQAQMYLQAQGGISSTTMMMMGVGLLALVLLLKR